AGDRRERFLEWRRDRRRHGLWTRARQGRADGDRREVDVRQVGYGEPPIGDDAEYQNPNHDQCRHDGASYEDRGEVHLDSNLLVIPRSGALATRRWICTSGTRKCRSLAPLGMTFMV